MKIARLKSEPNSYITAENGSDKFYKAKGDLFATLEATDELVDLSQGLAAPVTPPQVFAIGLNYRKHAEEFGNMIPEYPVVMFKNIAAVTGPNTPIIIPKEAAASFVDYEVELAIVIKKICKNVSEDEAMDYVLGYTIANDVTSRDWQKGSKGGGQWTRAKSFDSFCPLGPWIVTPDEIGDPNNLQLETLINGERRQYENSSDMIFPIQYLVSFLSKDMTLYPGAVILTGTPCGVGAAMDPRIRLAAGDEVRLRIENIGELVNTVE
jgi:2-keto-4-pentenoate hydratase/2-oxohepta-3-ene-1,7-dioic acid hydratase in catechol pathway